MIKLFFRKSEELSYLISITLSLCSSTLPKETAYRKYISGGIYDLQHTMDDGVGLYAFQQKVILFNMGFGTESSSKWSI